MTGTPEAPRIRRETVTLAECPIGLFWCQDQLCLKTEYGNNEGRIDAYIVSSGEFFWGEDPQTIANQRRQLVTPVDTDAAIRALADAPAGDGESAALVERKRIVDWLRSDEWGGPHRSWDESLITTTAHSIATSIEKGDHLPPPPAEKG